MERHGWSPGDVTRIVLSVGECVSNAVEHGARDAPLRIRLRVSEHDATVWVADGGGGPSPDEIANPSLPADALATSGRGLFIQSRLADEVAVDGACVRLTFRRSS